MANATEVIDKVVQEHTGVIDEKIVTALEEELKKVESEIQSLMAELVNRKQPVLPQIETPPTV